MQVFVEFSDHFTRLQAAPFWPDLLQQHRRHFKQGKVVLDDAIDARAQHLDRNLGAVGQARQMNLCDRGGGYRRAFKVTENLIDRFAIKTFQHVQCLCGGEGRDAVLQQRELVGEVGRQQVAPGRQHLAELDEDRSE